MENHLGTINGRYQLQQKLGEGGMGVVYRATDRLTGETVALKQVHLSENLQVHDSLAPGASEDDLRLALAHEFQILAGLRHPHIISVLDYGFDAAKRPYFTMTYLPESQNILVAAQNAPFERKIELIQQLLQALVYLHRRGVLHRDLKPDNVLVADGSVRLVDFGLSASDKLGSDSIGTPLYMAPELFEGASYSQPADLYAAGVVLYQLLTGKHPFEPFDHKFVDRVLEEAPDLENVDGRIRPFLHQLLAKTQKDRFTTAPDALLALAAALDQPPPPETAAIRESYLQAAKFVGRDAEMTQFIQAINQAAAGTGSAWLIGGESGVGKSRLLREVQTRALVQGFHLLRGQGIQGSGGVPFQLWRDPLRHLLITAPEIDDLSVGVLQPLIPDIAQLIGRAVEPAPELKDDEAKVRLFTTIARLFRRAERPLLLILEDLHWASESLLPLPFLTRQIENHQLLVIGSYRNDERPDLPQQLDHMHSIVLPRLSETEMSELSLAMLGQVGQQENIIAYLQQETEGNSFFAIELLRTLAEESGRLDAIGQMALPQNLLPKGIQSIVERRVSRVPEAKRPLLQLTAVVGRQVHLPLLQQLIDEEIKLADWLEICSDAAILEVENNQWQFTHDKIRVGILENMSHALRRDYHGRVAEGFAAIYQNAPEQATVIAYHWRHNGNEEQERIYAIQAGEYAATQYAHQDAADKFARALALTPAEDIEQRYQLLLALENAHGNLGQTDIRQQCVEELSKLAPQLDKKQQLVILQRQAQYLSFIRQLDAASLIVNQGITLAEQLQDHRMLMELYSQLSALSAIQVQHQDAGQYAQQAYEHALVTNDKNVIYDGLEALGKAAFWRGAFKQAIDYFQQRIQAVDNDLDRVQLGTVMYLGHAYWRLQQPERAQYYYEEGAKLAKQKGIRIYEAKLAGSLANHLMTQGEIEAAFDQYQIDLAISREIGDLDECTIVLLNLSVSYQWLGLWEEAQQAAEEAWQLCENSEWLRMPILISLMGAYGQLGNYPKAYETYQIAEALITDQNNEEGGFLYLQRGHIAYQEEKWEDGRYYFQKAFELLQKTDRIELLLQCQVGLALYFATHSDAEQATVFVKPFIERIEQEGLAGDWPAGKLGLFTYRVHQSLGETGQATAILNQTYTFIQKWASGLQNEAWRQSFLENVPENREIVRLFEAMQAQSLLEDQGVVNGRYQLQQKLGEGGMGIVYRATDRLTGEIVALKQVHLSDKLQISDTLVPNASEDDLRLALAHEFQILAGLRHPHIISVLDYGFDAAKRPYFTMTYLPDRQNILVAAQNAPFEHKIELIQQLLQALAYLHRRGVLHRDLKPDNILVADGTVRVLDFGLADSDKLSSDSIGTPLYLAPELFEGASYSQMADLYAVGVILCQLLTGKHPFEPFDHKFLDRVLEDDPNLAGVEGRIRPFTLRLLAKNPAHRYASANAALVALAEALGQPLPEETQAIRESYLQAAKFVGREAEMDQLVTALEKAQEGESAVWLIGGESGVGKSRLLDELRTIALVNGWQVWRGQTTETSGLPYQLWRHIVPYLLLNTELTTIELSILKEIAPQIDRLFKQTIPTMPSSNGVIDQERLAYTLVEVIRRQTQPTLLLLEDIHWARESLNPIKQILNIIQQLPHVMLVATYRSDDQPTFPTKLPEANLLMLDRLSDTEVRQLSQAMLGEQANTPEIVSLLTHETEGNTYFIIEIMRALAEEAGQLEEIGQMNLPTGILTSSMENLLQRRIQKIPDNDQHLLQLAAVAGRQLDSALLALLKPSEEMTAWLQRGLDAAVLLVRDDQWLFSHDKLRESIINSLSPATRQQLHRQVALGIEELYPDDQSYHQILLEHWHQAGDLDKEIDYLEPVARYLIQAVADHTKAVDLLARGLGMLPKSDPRRIALLNWQTYALIEQLDTQALEKAEQFAQEARKLAEQTNDLPGLAGSLHHLGKIAFEQDSSNKQADAYIQRSLDCSRSIGAHQQTSSSLILLGEMAHNRGNLDEAISYHHEALAIIESFGSYYDLGYSLDQLGQVYIVQGEYEKATEYLERSYEALQAGGYKQRLGWTLLNLANLPLLSGDAAGAYERLNHCLAVFHKYGIQTGVAYSLNNLGRTATLTEDYQAARDYLLRSIEIFEKAGTIRGVGYNLLQLGLLYSIQEAFEQAEQALQKSLAGFQEVEDMRFVAYSLARLGIVYLFLKPDQAQDTLYQALTLAHTLEIEPCILEIIFGYALLYLQEGQPLRAAELAGVAQYHPKSNKEIQLWLKLVAPKLSEALAANDLAQAIEKGKSHELAIVVQGLLAREQRISEHALPSFAGLDTLSINGRYQLTQKLGEGGMGVVYRATDRLTGETVALKQVHLSENLQVHDSLAPGASEDDLRLALAHEFQILAGLRHPHIISVLDYGFDAAKRPYFTMTYLPESQNILDAAKGKSFERKIELIQQFLQALAYLHRRGVLHRDLKPDNVLVVGGSVRVLDFGLSASGNPGSDSVGTPLYMAPELFTGQAYSPAADLYTVGVILYQLLTGQHPFAPFDFKFLNRVLEKEPDLANVDERIRPFLAQLLAKTAEERFTTAPEALFALAAALNQPPPPETAAIRESYLQAAKFVGREAEMAQLNAALDQATAGSGSAWLIGGESGVGKTRLISELRTQALVSGFQVLRGHTMEDGGQPYQVWRDPLRQLVTTLPDVDDLTAGVLLPLVPDMPHLLNRPVDPAPDLEEGAAQARLLTTIARLFRMAERPLLLVLEDLHHADVSLLPIPYLTRIVTQHPLLILGSYRSDERPNLPLDLPGMTHLLLPRLTPEAMSDLSAAMLGDAGRNAAVQALLQRETEGNAFFAVEVVRALAEEAGRLGNIGQMKLPETLLPNGIQDVVQRRVGRLPEEARLLLVKTAVAGRTLEPCLIHQFANDVDIENRWLPLCADAAVLDVQNGVWQFSHGKIRDGLYANLSLTDQVRLHQEVAQAVETCYPDDPEQAARLAYHWHRAQNPQKEQVYAWQAGQIAAEQFANADAITYFTQALAATPPEAIARRFEILLALEKIYDLTGQRDEGQAALAQLTEMATKLSDPQQQMTVMLRQVNLASNLGRFADADQLAAKAITFAQTHDLHRQIVLAQVMRARVLLIQGQPEACQTALQQAQTANQAIQDVNLELNILTIYRNLLEFQGNHQAALGLAEQRLHRSREAGFKLQEAKSLMTLGLAHDKLHHYHQAKQFLQESLALLVALGDRYSEGICLLNLGNLFIRYGDYDAAQDILRTCLQVSYEVNDQMNVGIVLYNLGVIAVWQARYDEAMEHVRASYEISQQISDREGDAYALTQLGKIHRLQGAYDEAQRCYQLALSLRQEMNQPHFFAENQIGLALLEIAMGKNPQQNVDAVLAVVQDNPIIAGVDSPFDIYQDLIEALLQQGHPQLPTILAQAHQLLQTQAAQFEDDAMRQSFLENIPAHRQIEAWFSERPFLNETINGRYQLHTKLGEGGMGIVYRATDRLTGETVALKQVHLSDKLQLHDSLAPGASEDELRLALAREFQILAGLRHPHIISVLDYGFDAAKRPYFTMTYLPESQNILDAAKGQSFERKIELIQQLLQALAYLHRRGVLHRDLKPDNILVADGSVRVLDFGLAASDKLGSDSIGTPLYMAPELFEEASYSQPADLYAAGVVLYQLLTGQHPFEPFDHNFLDRVLEEAPDLENVDERIRPFLHQLLAKTPQERFTTAPDALLALAAALDQPPPPETAAIRESYLQAAKFVGRDAEMAQLTAALNQAASGNGSAWLIGGESGVGKSRLIDELRTQALVSGFQVVVGQGVHGSGDLPYQFWVQPVKQLLLSASAVDDQLASVLRQILPVEIETLLGRPIPSAPPLSGQAARQRLYAALAQLIALQPNPVLIVLEDLQWAEVSLAPLPLLLRQVDSRPLLILGTYRNDERPHLPAELPQMNLLMLPRLGQSQMEALTIAILGEAGSTPALLAFLNRETEGNTFFVVEMLRQLAEETGRLQNIGQTVLPDKLLPGTVHEIVQRRIDNVPSQGHELLQLAAVAGRELDLPLLLRLAGEDVDVQNWWLPVCAETAVLEVNNNQWRFAHDKIREALLANLAAPRLASYHAQVANGLVTLYDEQPAYAATIAFHWQRANQPENEVKYLVRAGDHAISQYLYHEAADYYERAAQLISAADTAVALREKIDLQNKLTRSLLQHDPQRAYTLAEQAYRLTQNSLLAAEPYTYGVAQSLKNKGNALRIQGSPAQSIPILLEAQHLFEALQNLDEAGFTSGKISEAYFQLRQFEKAEPYAIQAQQLAERIHNVPLLLDSYVNLALIYEGLKKDEEAWEYMQKGLQLARQIGDRYHEVSILNNLSFTLSNQNKCAEALEMALQGLEIARKLEFTLTIDLLLRNIVSCCIRLEKFAEAELYLKEHNQVATQLGFEKSLVAHVIIKSELDLAQGRPEDSLAALQSAEANEENIENSYVKIRLYAALAQIHEALGNDEEVARYQALGQIVAGGKEEENVSVNGRYQLTQKLGEGGMGIVYRATDRLTGETVALKQVHLSDKLQLHDSLAPGATEDDLRLALAHEFQILAGLRHPHIISVLDYGFDAAKRPYFTMTYLPESQNILDAAKDAPFERKIELTQQLLQALAYLHRRSVLHRDLKPDNVLVIDGSVRVLDFGLSASDKLGSDSIGTPLYMAPELFEGKSYTQSADLYAAGIVLYQLLTGQHPFEPFDHKFLDRVLEEAPDLENVDGRIRPFLTQLLAKTQKDRFATAPDALLALAAALGQPAPPETAAIRESYLQAAKFVGREAEMAQLAEALHQAASGQGSAWLIGGESGVGKSRLLNELQTQALVAGFQVWRGQAIAEQGALLQVWQEIVGMLVLNTTLSEREAGILKEICPKLEQLLGQPVPDLSRLEGPAHLQRLINTLVSVIQRQKQPVLLLLEDLHWARESLRPLEQLVYELDGQPLLIVGTYRNDERPKLPTELGRAVQLLTLLPFNESGVQELTEAMLGRAGKQPELVAQLLQETEGNVFFLVEVLRAWAEGAGGLGEVRRETAVPHQLLTGGILQVVKRRLQKVPQNYQPLLRLAAIGGRQLDLNVLARLRETVDLQAWLLACNEAMVLEVTDNTWRFAHDKLREGLLQNLDTAAKKQGHQQVATAIEATYDHPEEQAVILATHWREAGNPTKEIYYSLKASEQLYHAGNFERVIELLERLQAEFQAQIADSDRFSLLHLLGEAYRGTNQYANSLASHQAALALARQRADQQAIVNQLIGLGWSTWGQLQYENRLRDKAGWEAAEACFQEALPLAETLGDQVGMGRCLHNLGLVFAVRDRDVKKGLGYMQRGLHVVQAAQKPEYLLISLYDIGLFTMEHDLAAGKAYFSQALALAHEVGRPRIIRYILQSLTNVALFEADWPNFERHLQELTQFSKNRRDFFYTAVNRLAAILAIHRGELDLAEHHVRLNLHNQDRPHLDTTFEHCQQAAVALRRADSTQLSDSLTQGFSAIKKAPVTHAAYLAGLQAGAYFLAEENEKGGAWLALAEAHLALSPNKVQERAHHVTDVMEQLRYQFQQQLATNAAQAGKARAALFSLAAILAEWQEAEPGSLPLVQAVESVLFDQLETINGRYQLTQKLGEGGMGIVYRATDRLTGETVALKQVHLSENLQVHDSLAPGATEDDLRLALAHEFQILAGLRHPHIISVLDYGFDAAKRPYFTMTYLPESQNIQVAAQNAPFKRKIELIQQLLQALAYLHRRGVLHRDLKPDNILVAHGTVRVLDFGLADSDKLGSDSIGTPLYMAPELFEGESYTQSADLYAAGIVLYQLLTGQHPFEPSDHKFLDRVLEEAPDLENVDGRIRPFLTQLLAKTPQERFATAPDALFFLAEALGQPAPPETAAIRESYLQAAKFVGRDVEMAQLTGALAKAASSNGSAWLIGGESGIGKTRLISELHTQALVSGFQVLRGQTAESGGQPYEAWREPVRHLVAMLPGIDDLTASVLLPLVPDIAHLLSREVEPAPELKEDAAQTRLFTTIARLFWKAERPLLLVLEDLHLADASLLPLPYLTRLVADYPLLILGSYRSDERPNLPEVLDGLTHLPLPRLTPEAMADLSAAMLGDAGRNDAVQALLQRETEGNAFFAVEVVRALAEEAGRLGNIGQMGLPEMLLPNGIKDIVQRRVGKLPVDAKELLVKTAVAGRELELPLIQQLADNVDVENEWLPLCADAAILDVQNGVWQFSHGKIRDGLLAELDQAAKATLHAEIANAIEQLHPNDESQAVRLAYHWQEAQNDEKERHYAELAGRQAADQFAHQDALRYFKRALELTAAEELEQQYVLLMACYNAYSFMGQVDKQQATLRRLSELAHVLADSKKQVEILHWEGFFHYWSGELDTALQKFAQAVTESRANKLAAFELEALVGWAMALGQRRELAEAFDKIAQAQALLEQVDDPTAKIRLTNVLSLLKMRAGDVRQSVMHLRENLQLSRAQNLTSHLQVAMSNLAVRCNSLGEYEQAEAYYQEALAVTRQLGNVPTEATILNNLGLYYSSLGAYAQAITTLNDGLALCQQTGKWTLYSYALNNIGVAYHKRGELAQAKAYFQQAIEQKQALKDRWSEAFTQNRLGHLLLDSNETAEALTVFQTAVSLQANLSLTPTLVESWAGLAVAHARLGKLNEARQYAEQVWDHLQEKGFEGEWLWATGALQLYMAFLVLEDGRATAVLHQAHAELQKRAANIATEASRQKFLTQVPENRALVQLFETLPIGVEVAETAVPTPTKPDLTEEDLIEQILAEAAGKEAEPRERLRGEALLTHLLAVSRRMATMRSVSPLLSYAMNEVISLVGAERGYIVLINDDGTLDFRVRRRADGTDIRSDADTISHSILAEVVQTQQSLVVRNALMDPRFGAARSVVAMQLRSIMCAPLITQDRIIGAIYVESRSRSGRFTEDDLAPLEFFSNQAAVAIENANLNENLEELVAERTWELAEAKEEAEAANAAKTNFLSNMSHELRTPLNAILNFTGFVYDGLYGEVNEEQQQALQQSLDSGEHLLSLINDILDLNKIEAGMMRLVFEEIDLNKIMHHAISTAKGLVKGQPIELIVEVEPDLPVIQADRRRLRQILLNVLSNSAKYTERGSITIGARHLLEDGLVELQIRDTGIGIDPEDHHLVFEAYGQAKANLSNVVSTGLGMAITYDLVRLHNGRIWFESDAGAGTTFYMQLPTRQEG